MTLYEWFRAQEDPFPGLTEHSEPSSLCYTDISSVCDSQVSELWCS